MTKGNLEKELYLWDFFYRYEAHIGVLISIILVAPIFLLGISHFREHAEFLQLVLYLLLLVFVPGAVLTITIVGLTHPKDGDLGQGALLFSTILGYIGSFIVHFSPLLIVVLFFHEHLLDDRNILYANIIYWSIYYIILFWTKRNIRDYVNWRFDWAILNYNNLLSNHDVWWTSFVQRSVQRLHMKYFRSYKRNASLVMIMTPMIISGLIFLTWGESPSVTNNKIEETQNTNNSQDSNLLDKSNAINLLSDSIDSTNSVKDTIDLESEESLSPELRDIELSINNTDNEAFDNKEETTSDVGVEMIIFERQLNETDIDNMTKREMSILRNMVYARHGYKFKNEELQEYFSKFSWYSPITDNASAVYNELSEVEKYNVDFIRKHE